MSSDNKKLSLLILEDSEEDCILLVRKLGREGQYDLSHARVDTLAELQKALDDGSWDLIISDHSMPQLDAIGALKELHDRRLDVPMIIVSGTIAGEEAVAAMKAGASDFIMKDDLTRLLPAIERELREAKSRREKRLAEEQFHQSQKMESVGRLAGGIAHDFNNILTAIGGYCHFLLNALPPGDKKREDVEEIKIAADRASALTSQLLAFSRQQVLQPKILDCNAVVADMEKMLKRIIGEDMELSTSLALDLGRVKADPSQVEQVILNLVVNARDAMPKGGRITIETSNVELEKEYARMHLQVPAGAYVMLAVSDTGTGMDSRTLNRLFEPFFTTKELGKGTGLGLATVYGVVKQSGGGIYVYSEPEHGTAFKIYFPRVEEGLQPAAAAAPRAETSAGTETILLVEDDDMVRKFVQRALVESGYTLLAAKDPSEALRFCEERKEPIHLVLTDVIMPQMHGPELVKRLLLLRPGLKAIYMSGYADVVHRERIGDSAPFLQKPVGSDVLARKIREVLDGSP